MRKTGLTVLVGLMLVSVTTFGADNKRMPTAVSSTDPGKFYVGVSADSAITRLGLPSLSMMFGLGEKLALQTYTGLNNNAGFNFGVGATVKYTVLGDYWKGFHLGGGLGLGLTTAAENFYISFLVGPGFHYQIVDGVMFVLDAGVSFAVITGGGGVRINLGGNGTDMLGASLLFRL